MRLTKQTRAIAKQELLELLSHGSRRTSELSGTPRFHGEHTLRFAKVRELLHELREEGKVDCQVGGHGLYTYFSWSLSGCTYLWQ